MEVIYFTFLYKHSQFSNYVEKTIEMSPKSSMKISIDHVKRYESSLMKYLVRKYLKSKVNQSFCNN